MSEYRVIPLEVRDGLTNTVLDEALVPSLNGSPIVVFTSWEPTVSISQKQNLRQDVDVEAVQRVGAQLVKRKSGGRTVYLDQGYIGFTIAQPLQGPGYTGIDIPGSYEGWLSRITDALAELGINTEIQDKNDIIVDGKKIGNAAQMQRSWIPDPKSPEKHVRYLLVHGSLRTYVRDFDAMMDVLKIDGIPLKPFAEEARRVITSVGDETNVGPDELYETLRDHLCPGVKTRRFTVEELRTIDKLKNEYSDIEWINGTGLEPSRGPCDFIFGERLMIPSLIGRVKPEVLKHR